LVNGSAKGGNENTHLRRQSSAGDWRRWGRHISHRLVEKAPPQSSCLSREKVGKVASFRRQSGKASSPRLHALLKHGVGTLLERINVCAISRDLEASVDSESKEGESNKDQFSAMLSGRREDSPSGAGCALVRLKVESCTGPEGLLAGVVELLLRGGRGGDVDIAPLLVGRGALGVLVGELAHGSNEKSGEVMLRKTTLVRAVFQ